MFDFHNYLPSPAHRFDPPQHERLGGKTFLDLQLGHLQAVPNVRKIAGSLQNLGYQIGVLDVAKLELREGFFQREPGRQLADPIELPGRLADGLFSTLVRSAFG